MSFPELRIDAVDPTWTVAMPDPWPALEKRIDPDLLLRARGFKLRSMRDGLGTLADEVLRIVGLGFVEPFSSFRFKRMIQDGDPAVVFKLKFLGALEDLAKEFVGRVSAVVWNSLAVLGTRENPHIEQKIRTVKNLPHPWWFVDSVLHGLGKVYGLHFHVQSRICAATGHVLDHNCDCDHSAKQVIAGQSMNFLIPSGQFKTASAALMSHVLCETLLVGGMHLPFELGVSNEAQP